MTESNSNSSSSTPPSFEQALAALEQIVHDLEEGRLGLAESLGRYEEAVKLLKQCYIQLEQAERRVELLTGLDAAGNPITQPFDDSATLGAPQEETPTRSRRGGKSSKRQPDKAEPDVMPQSSTMDEPGSLF